MENLSKVSDERKMQVRVVFMVIVIFVSILLIVLYSAIANDSLKNSVNDKVNSSPVVGRAVVNSMLFSNNQANVAVKIQATTATYTADVQKPSPCHQVKAEVVTTTSGLAHQNTLQITITSPAAGTVCAQVLSTQTVTGQLNFSDGDSLIVTLDGKNVPQVME